MSSPVLLQTLSASETYTVQVATQTSVGESAWSQLSMSSSPLGSTPSEPTAVFLFPSSVTGELSASWNTPNQTGGLPILDYTVALFADQAGPPIQTQTTTSTFILITGLSSGIQFSVRVSARNSVGDGPQSSFSQTTSPA